MSAVVIAEIGHNHKGEIEIAKELLKVAKQCGADFVKFQKRCVKELLSEAEYRAPHPHPYNSYGASYGEHREYLEFTLDQHKELKDYCDQLGIGYSCSVWDLTSSREIASLAPAVIKVPSAHNNNFPLIDWLCRNYGGEIHVSLGMTTRREEEELVDFFIKAGRAQDVVLYACTSGYPVAIEDTCLLEIVRLKKTYGSTVKQIGFSGHHLGIAIDVAAFVLGASYIERHFTLNRVWKGTDHAASLEPTGLSKLVRDIRNTALALTCKSREILEIEVPQRNKLKWKNDQRK